jgi:hypothetical protein
MRLVFLLALAYCARAVAPCAGGPVQSIGPIPTCTAAHCQDTFAAHSCTSPQTTGFTYYFKTPKPTDLKMPANGSGLVTYSSCYACFAQCRYDIRTNPKPETTCLCGQLDGADVWVRDQVWLKNDTDVQTRTVQAAVVDATPNTNPQRALDPTGANLGYTQGRRIDRAVLQPVTASTLSECANTCTGACKAWQWDSKQGACWNVPLLEPSVPLKNQAEVQTCMRWRGLDTTQGNVTRMSMEPFAYGRTAPNVKEYQNSDDQAIWSKPQTFGLRTLHVLTWCGEHAACHEIECNCRLYKAMPANSAALMLALDSRQNLGWTVDVILLVPPYQSFFNGGGLGNMYALYANNKDDSNMSNPYLPVVMPMPAGVVPGAPWPNAVPLTAQCPVITHWRYALLYDSEELDLNVIACTPAGDDANSTGLAALLPRWRPPGNGEAFCNSSTPDRPPTETYDRANSQNQCTLDSLTVPPWSVDVRCSSHKPPQNATPFWSTYAGRCQAIMSANENGTRCMIASASGDLNTQGTSAAKALQPDQLSNKAAFARIANFNDDVSPAALDLREWVAEAADAFVAEWAMVDNALPEYASGQTPSACSRAFDVATSTRAAVLHEPPGACTDTCVAAPAFVAALIALDDAAWDAVHAAAGPEPWLFLGYDPERECSRVGRNCTFVGDAPPRPTLQRIEGVLVAGARRCALPPPWRRCRLRAARRGERGERADTHVCFGVSCSTGYYASDGSCKINPHNLATFRREAVTGDDDRRVRLAQRLFTFYGATTEWESAVARMAVAACAELDVVAPYCTCLDTRNFGMPAHTPVPGASRTRRVAHHADVDAIEIDFDPYADTAQPYAAAAPIQIIGYSDGLYEAAADADDTDALAVLLDASETRNASDDAAGGRYSCAPRQQRSAYHARVPVWTNKHHVRADWSCWLPAAAGALPASTILNTELTTPACSTANTWAGDTAGSKLERAAERGARPLLPRVPRGTPANVASSTSNVSPNVCATRVCSTLQAQDCSPPTTDRCTLPSPTPLTTFGNETCAGVCSTSITWDGHEWGCEADADLSVCDDGSAMLVDSCGTVLHCGRDETCTGAPARLPLWFGFRPADSHVFAAAGPGAVELTRSCKAATEVDAEDVSEMTAPRGSAPFTRTCRRDDVREAHAQLPGMRFVPAAGGNSALPDCFVVTENVKANLLISGVYACAQGAWRVAQHGLLGAPGPPGMFVQWAAFDSFALCAAYCLSQPYCAFCTSEYTAHGAAAAGDGAPAPAIVYVQATAVATGSLDYKFQHAALPGRALHATCAPHVVSLRGAHDALPCQVCEHGTGIAHVRELPYANLIVRAEAGYHHTVAQCATAALNGTARRAGAAFAFDPLTGACHAGTATVGTGTRVGRVHVAKCLQAPAECNSASARDVGGKDAHIVAVSNDGAWSHVPAHAVLGQTDVNKVPPYVLGVPLNVTGTPDCATFLSTTAAHVGECTNGSYTTFAVNVSQLQPFVKEGPLLWSSQRSFVDALRCRAETPEGGIVSQIEHTPGSFGVSVCTPTHPVVTAGVVSAEPEDLTNVLTNDSTWITAHITNAVNAINCKQCVVYKLVKFIAECSRLDNIELDKNNNLCVGTVGTFAYNPTLQQLQSCGHLTSISTDYAPPYEPLDQLAQQLLSNTNPHVQALHLQDLVQNQRIAVPLQDVSYFGTPNYTVSAEDVFDCAQQCAANMTCTAFAFVEQSQTPCTHISATSPQHINASGVVSGVIQSATRVGIVNDTHYTLRAFDTMAFVQGGVGVSACMPLKLQNTPQYVAVNVDQDTIPFAKCQGLHVNFNTDNPSPTSADQVFYVVMHPDETHISTTRCAEPLQWFKAVDPVSKAMGMVQANAGKGYVVIDELHNLYAFSPTCEQGDSPWFNVTYTPGADFNNFDICKGGNGTNVQIHVTGSCASGYLHIVMTLSTTTTKTITLNAADLLIGKSTVASPCMPTSQVYSVATRPSAEQCAEPRPGDVSGTPAAHKVTPTPEACCAACLDVGGDQCSAYAWNPDPDDHSCVFLQSDEYTLSKTGTLWIGKVTQSNAVYEPLTFDAARVAMNRTIQANKRLHMDNVLPYIPPTGNFQTSSGRAYRDGYSCTPAQGTLLEGYSDAAAGQYPIVEGKPQSCLTSKAPAQLTNAATIDLGGFDTIQMPGPPDLTECAFVCAENKSYTFVAAQYGTACSCVLPGPPGVLEQQLQTCAPIACSELSSQADCGIVQGTASEDVDDSDVTSVFIPRKGAPMQYEVVQVMTGAAPAPAPADHNSVPFPQSDETATTQDRNLKAWVVLTEEVMKRRKLSTVYSITQTYADSSVYQSFNVS